MPVPVLPQIPPDSGVFAHQTHPGYYNGTNSNPRIGTFDTPNAVPNAGGGPGPGNPVTVPSGNDYTGWSWEQILSGVLGLAMPGRNDVASGRWTFVEQNSSGEGSNLFYIMGITWGQHKDTLIFLNPDILKPKGAWDMFYNTPQGAIEPAFEIPANYAQGGLKIDPRTFADGQYAMAAVQDFYVNAAGTFGGIAASLAGEGSQYKGKGGEAFQQLVDNLHTAVGSVFSQIDGPPSYSDLIKDAGVAAGNFLTGIWNSYVNWASQMTYSPLGAIIQVLMDGNVIVHSGNSWTIPGDPTKSSFGDLTTEGPWVTIDSMAQGLWLRTLTTYLDSPAQAALNNLVTSYSSSSTGLQPIQPQTLPGITTPIANINGNINANLNPATADALNGIGNIQDFLANLPNFLNHEFANEANANLGSQPNLGAAPNMIPNVGAQPPPVSNLGQLPPNAGGGPLPLNAPPVANLGLNAGGQPGGQLPLNAPPVVSNLGQLPPNAGGGPLPLNAGSGRLPLNAPVVSNLGQLPLNASGQPGGQLPLNALGGQTSPLSSPAQVSAPLSRAVAADNALNGALGRALTSGEVPASGPLHNDLKSAVADSGKLTGALDQALESGGTPSSSALHRALTDNNALNGDLRAALAKAPKTGPLHNALEKALADSGKVNSDLHQALANSGQAGLVGTPLDKSTVINPGQGLIGNKALLNGLQQGQLRATAGAPAGGVQAAGLGATAPPVSSGRFTPAATAGTAVAGQGAASPGAVPFYPPMAGGMGGMGGMGGQGDSGERERTTWLAEDEDVWGTEPDVGPHVLGRDFSDEEEAVDAFDEFVEHLGKRASRGTSREGAR